MLWSLSSAIKPGSHKLSSGGSCTVSKSVGFTAFWCPLASFDCMHVSMMCSFLFSCLSIIFYYDMFLRATSHMIFRVRAERKFPSKCCEGDWAIITQDLCTATDNSPVTTRFWRAAPSTGRDSHIDSTRELLHLIEPHAASHAGTARFMKIIQRLIDSL